MARVCSVWDWDRLRYDYFIAPGRQSVGGWAPLTGLGIAAGASKGGIGLSIEDFLQVLPRGARKIGSGTRARGTVCRRKPAQSLGAIQVNGTAVAEEMAAVIIGVAIGLGLGGMTGGALRPLGMLLTGLTVGWTTGRSS